MDTLYEAGNLRISRLIVGSLDNNVYVVSSAAQAIIIDAAAEPDRILAAVDGLEVTTVLTTHGHHDHVGAVDVVTEKLKLPFRMHEADSGIAGLDPQTPIHDGDEFLFGESSIRALHTPGHTPGSTSFLIGIHLFTGDTLFPGGPGATRFPYSSFDTIMQSLDERLFVLDDATTVYPGHGPHTTIGTERPHLEEWRRRRW
jgi:glyoxylase-like metal-dependent hydrolase (beta-lactamase superfamily II)